MGDYIRWSPPYYEGAHDSAALGAVPVAQPQQALDPPRPQERAAAARRCCGSSREYDVVLESFRPGVLDRLGVGYERMREAQPRDRLLRDLRLRPGRPQARRLRPRHELPRPDRPARPDRRARRRAGAGRRPDRRPRRRRADGRVRDHGRAARARRWARASGLGRGPDGRRLDGRRRALVAGDGGRLPTSPTATCRAAASCRWRARSSATARTSAPTAGSRSARWSRSSGRRGAAASGARS